MKSQRQIVIGTGGSIVVNVHPDTARELDKLRADRAARTSAPLSNVPIPPVGTPSDHPIGSGCPAAVGDVPTAKPLYTHEAVEELMREVVRERDEWHRLAAEESKISEEALQKAEFFAGQVEEYRRVMGAAGNTQLQMMDTITNLSVALANVSHIATDTDAG